MTNFLVKKIAPQIGVTKVTVSNHKPNVDVVVYYPGRSPVTIPPGGIPWETGRIGFKADQCEVWEIDTQTHMMELNGEPTARDLMHKFKVKIALTFVVGTDYDLLIRHLNEPEKLLRQEIGELARLIAQKFDLPEYVQAQHQIEQAILTGSFPNSGLRVLTANVNIDLADIGQLKGLNSFVSRGFYETEASQIVIYSKPNVDVVVYYQGAMSIIHPGDPAWTIDKRSVMLRQLEVWEVDNVLHGLTLDERFSTHNPVFQFHIRIKAQYTAEDHDALIRKVKEPKATLENQIRSLVRLSAQRFDRETYLDAQTVIQAVLADTNLSDGGLIVKKIDVEVLLSAEDREHFAKLAQIKRDQELAYAQFDDQREKAARDQAMQLIAGGDETLWAERLMQAKASGDPQQIKAIQDEIDKRRKGDVTKVEDLISKGLVDADQIDLTGSAKGLLERNLFGLPGIQRQSALPSGSSAKEETRKDPPPDKLRFTGTEDDDESDTTT